MKALLAQPAKVRFEWELEICIRSLLEHGISDIVLLFSKDNDEVVKRIQTYYPVQCYVYEDNREDKSYIPSIKPYLWYRYLQEFPEAEKETYFYLDADCVLTESIDFSTMKYKENCWIGSDCSHYLNADYILSKGNEILEKMAQIVGVSVESILSINELSAGAQWIIDKPSATYWYKVYQDSNKLYHYLNGLSSDIQKWTAEMWAQLWNVLYFDKKVEISKELDFCWATDPIEYWDQHKIYHNAGVVDDKQDLFFKGKYVYRTPFQDDLSFVNPSKCSYKYVELLKQAGDKHAEYGR
ncbi:bacteriophage protein [Listeria fleischmannii 1991]|uniref:Uncharacterized protein n=2 Tax=Listeria fleischmannii TaxID=1069827 RepID=A0A2X3HD36_9LIST|nr:hypothetical protein [Listeria fleischmannii]EMG27070.1 hypothetical protein LFLEISCH_12985 [Listeria fleischmannii subsp. fleischmannii LU2006-1]KMT60964.1 bacteriophage protein [Listeria fleischmannii 1991]SQC70593.1 Uncharacterised protein [Listeria fleischmannii subsp. fleischmannii]